MAQLWGGRFTKETDQLVYNFNASISFDQKFYKEDIEGSIAHVTMLGKQGIISQAESNDIVACLKQILKEVESGELEISSKYEDIHSFVEATLIDRLGDTGKKLHTGRSRNDQVALDMRLFTRKTVKETDDELKELLAVILKIMKENTQTIMPGFTHLQKAQPITLAHHFGAYMEMFKRDYDRMNDIYDRMNYCPLGSGALAGTTYPLDRELTASLLDFYGPVLTDKQRVILTEYYDEDLSLAEIAEDILRMDARAIFLAGPSSSGKTTTANRLKIHLRVLGMHPVLISMDNFYLNRPDVPLDEHGKPDLESLYALDIELFRHCIRDLLDGKTAQLPEYDFATGMRKEKSIPLRISHDQMLIIEGIHGLNPELHKGFEPGEICKFYLSELTCLNLDDHNRIRTTDARLLRRIVRDYQFRGTTPEKTLAMWDSVRRGEEKWIFPYQEQADIVFNTALHYELPVLRRYAYDMLQRITPDEPDYFRANRLIKILNYFLPAPDDAMQEIPPLSILREFIGGNTFYNE